MKRDEMTYGRTNGVGGLFYTATRDGGTAGQTSETAAPAKISSEDASSGYRDIINLPHHTSPTRPHMAREGRAAQFASFAALVGYEAAVEESARLTEAQVELDEEQKAMLNARLVQIEADERALPVRFTYFKADAHKEGGAYLTLCGVVRTIDAFARVVVIEDGNRIPIDDIVSIDADWMSEAE